MFAGVPRVYALFQYRIEKIVKGSKLIKHMKFNWGYGRQLKSLESSDVSLWSGIFDVPQFNKFRERLLPNGRICTQGSSPLHFQT